MTVKSENLLEVMNGNGERQQIEVVMAFATEDTNKQYVVYTLNEKKENDMVILYASTMVEQDGNIILEDISDEEWSMVKYKMREVIYTERSSQQ